MEKQPQNKIEIKPMGSYFEIDENGYLINPASLDKIQEEWKPALDDIVEVYKKHFGDKLISVYVRGSVAKGQAVKNISDIDMICYVDLKQEEINNKWADDFEKILMEKYPFVTGAELGASPEIEIKDDHRLLNQAVLLYGKELDILKIKFGKDLLRHLPNINNRVGWFDNKIKKVDSVEETRQACVWFMKEMLRAGFELTIEKSGRYTRDLYLCYKDFSEYYPDKEPLMREVLDLALNPTDDKKKILEIKEKITPFLIQEAEKVL